MTTFATRVAILGAGYISEFHIAAIRRMPDAELVAICDLNEALAQQTATSFGIPKVYASLEVMLAVEKLDVVHVLTPPQTHAVMAKLIAAAGVDVFIEKPMCHTVAACQELRAVADSEGAAVGVGHNFLYYPLYERLVEDVRSGRLGQIDQVEIVWTSTSARSEAARSARSCLPRPPTFCSKWHPTRSLTRCTW